MMTAIVTEIEAGSLSQATAEMKGRGGQCYHSNECRGKLKRLLTSASSEISMKAVSFYRENKEDRGGMMEICKKVMDTNMISVIASHLLEWCIQVLDFVSSFTWNIRLFN